MHSDKRSLSLVRMLFAAAVFGWLLPGANAQPGAADVFPSRPVRMIIPFPPGGGTDALARPIAQKLSELWGQQVIVDNRAGAGGIIGAQATARAAPDGYTFMLGTNGTHGINQTLYPNLPYDTLRDFTAITQVAIAPNILVIHPSVNVSSVQELIALAKAQPGKLNYGSAGSGSNPHLAAEVFKKLAGVDITHVPYKGSGPALTDLLAGQVQIMFANAPTVLGHIKAGRLRGLATTSAQKLPGLTVLAEFPTLAEAGLTGYEADTWYGVFGPAGLKGDVLKSLNAGLVKVLSLPEIREAFARQGAEVVPNSPEAFSAILKAEIAKWAPVIRESGAKVE